MTKRPHVANVGRCLESGVTYPLTQVTVLGTAGIGVGGKRRIEILGDHEQGLGQLVGVHMHHLTRLKSFVKSNSSSAKRIRDAKVWVGAHHAFPCVFAANRPRSVFTKREASPFERSRKMAL